MSHTDGYLGYLSCTEKAYQHSDHLLSVSLIDYRNKIEALGDRETVKFFNQNQQDWLNYRDSTCRYLSSSAIKGSDAYTHLYQLCILTENYNRIDFLNRPIPIS
ncbi:lysozyme inhibitor LprI family protein [Rosenbergiella collisarenosi]|uniref:lysozyme inhibitor LprI family protein n=1 Tax=Rosenbergiella collisarenosi TaxID=1544695 RepID=UPI0034DF595D